MPDLIQTRAPKPAPKPGKFKTTKRMRSICTEFRNWIVYTATYEDDRDAGKMDAADLVAWLMKLSDLEPDNLAVQRWRSLDDAERERPGPSTGAQIYLGVEHPVSEGKRNQ